MTTRPRPATVEDAIAEGDQHHDQKRAIQAKTDASRPDAWQSIQKVTNSLKSSYQELDEAKERFNIADHIHTEACSRTYTASDALRKKQVETDKIRPMIAEMEKSLGEMKRQLKEKEEECNKLKEKCDRYREEEYEAGEEYDQAQDRLDTLQQALGDKVGEAVKELDEAIKKGKGPAGPSRA